MALDFHGDRWGERPPARRWLSLVAVVIPVVSFVVLTAWFIRVFIAPPRVAIMDASAATAQAPDLMELGRERLNAEILKEAALKALARNTESGRSDVPRQTAPAQEAVATTEHGRARVNASMGPALPMLASLAAAPPVLASAPVTIEPAAVPPEPVDEPLRADTTGVGVPAPRQADASLPAATSIPLPRPKHHVAMALSGGAVPLPRSKPAELAPDADLPDVERHAAE